MGHSILALELCLRLTEKSRLRDELHRLVASHPTATGPREKSELVKRASELLVENDYLFEMGCWDFFDDSEKALEDYQMWSNGMITEEGARTRPSGFPERYGGEPRYMTFTIALLLATNRGTERALAKVCEIPQDSLWSKESFRRVLRGLADVDFAFVKSLVIYLIPGEEDWGLTADDLKDPKFEYLRKIV